MTRKQTCEYSKMERCTIDITRRVCCGNIGDAKKGRPDFCKIFGKPEENSAEKCPFDELGEIDDLWF